MGSLSTARFCKQKTCPSAEILLSHCRRGLAPWSPQQIKAHLAACDFCAAEMQLLARVPDWMEAPDCPPAEIPDHLRLLAEELLGNPAKAAEKAALTAAYPRGWLTLTDA